MSAKAAVHARGIRDRDFSRSSSASATGFASSSTIGRDVHRLTKIDATDTPTGMGMAVDARRYACATAS